MTRKGGLPRDPFALFGNAGAFGFKDTTGRTLVNPSILATMAGLGVFVVAGQSNAANTVPGTYSTSNPGKVFSVDPFTGALYRAAEPVIGPDGTEGTWQLRLADKLIAAGKYQNIVFASVAIGGTSVNLWKSDGPYSQRISVAAERLKNLGLTQTAFLWQQGEIDGQTGMPQATYQSALSDVIATQRAREYMAPWLIAKSTYNLDITNAAIRAAQTAIVNTGNGIFAGPDTDTLTGTTNRRDTTHFSVIGADAAATLWRDAIIAAL